MSDEDIQLFIHLATGLERDLAPLSQADGTADFRSDQLGPCRVRRVED